ncbi:MAG: hypothetical protein JW940_00285, partial [Polyangiaceae bacterium]|nr:hypothetical protein [Polyangiaceae bacterium]
MIRSRGWCCSRIDGLAPAGRTRWFSLVFGLVLVGCPNPGPQRQTAGAQPARGDRVVVEQTAATFFEARVLEAKGESLRLQTHDGELVSAQMGDVYRLPGPAAGLRPGLLAICRTEPRQWTGCRVESVSERTVAVSDASGRHMELARNQVLLPTAVTLLNLEHRFDLVRQQADFELAFRRAGRPMPPAGWRPSLDEKVVARLGSEWFTAKIHEITDDGLYVRWAVDGQITEVAREDVVPQPAPRGAIARGSYALARPASPAKPWRPVRVLAGTDDALTITDAAGHELPARARDIIPLPNP